ncbi:MAG: lysyl-tRNA synthetase, class [Campylobacterota bacterium]|nr:lysyl-tRNA synthetase, class [Campylobacterota bacterium]
MFENSYIKQRIEKSEQLRKMGLNPYDNKSQRNVTIEAFKEKYSYVLNSESKRDETKSKSIAGRIKFLRLMGKAAFAKIEDQTDLLQVYYGKDTIGEEWFNEVKKLVEVGDIIEVKGYPFVTQTGELSLHASELKILTKTIKPLPEKFHGLQDMELRYRQRYLDLIMNPDVKKVFKTRSKIISLIRDFFENKGFLEVETPMLHPIAGGANARPFITHHNALNVERYMRIAPDLYLKRLIVGGFEAVFEINRNFRNEGMDHTHNPEFTMIEFYWAYKTYEDLINITQDMFDTLIKELHLTTVLPYGEYNIDFSSPFARYTYDEALIKVGGISEDIIKDSKKIKELLQTKGITFTRELSLGALKAELFDEFVEKKLINPTFITDFPVEISPLARRKDEAPELTDRFELFVAGKEIANGFSELNDPIDQYQRFEQQLKAKEGGDDEAHEMDEDYINALSYGMAPTAGEGIGIDRLVMLLTNQQSIRDVLLFPAMKPIHNGQNQEEE